MSVIMDISRQRIVDFVKDNPSIPQLQFIREDPDGVDISEISGDGILNYVYLVKSASNASSIILKYGEDKAKFSSVHKVSLERQRVEYEGLKLLNRVKEGVAPRAYCLDTNHHITIWDINQSKSDQESTGNIPNVKIAMEDLSGMDLLQAPLSAGDIDVRLAADLGKMFAELHRATRRENMTRENHQQLTNIFGDAQFKQDRVEFRLRRCFTESDVIIKVHDDCIQTYRDVIQEVTSSGILQSLRDLMYDASVLTHGDCHPKSIFVKGDKFAIFDLEWMCLGHPAYDLAFTLSWYVILMIGNNEKRNASKIRADTLLATTTMLRVYVDESGESERTFMTAVAGFMGATVFSNAHFAFLENFAHVPPAGRKVLMNLGAALMRAYHQDTVTDIPALLQLIQTNT